MKNFGLIGVAGYVAPRHLQAISETGNNLIACVDKFDSVGIMDSYFPKAKFFTEFESFESYVESLKREQQKLDYISICSPNFLHDAHIKMALRNGADAICEKPLVLCPNQITVLEQLEKESGQKVNTILQLRLHPRIIALKNKVESENINTKYDVDLTYITSRGNWYGVSWKGDENKSGGLATNIGIHFFDMLSWIFGELQETKVYLREKTKVSGYFEFEKARVQWFLSIDENLLPEEIKNKGQRTYRSITVNGDEIEFSKGFTDLHTLSYREVLNENGFGLSEAKTSIEIVNKIKVAELSSPSFRHKFL